MSERALGIDIGGTGIKAALVDLERGALATERIRVLTPQPATPAAVAASVGELARPNAQTERHGIRITFPDRTRTYTVVLGGKAGPGNSTGEFLQLDVRTVGIQQ